MVSATFDPKFRTMYINFTGRTNNKVTKTITVADGQELDIDKDGNAVGLELMFSSNINREASNALLKTLKNQNQKKKPASYVFHIIRRDVPLTPHHRPKPKLMSR